MSNNQVGNVYAQIIDDVIMSSRLDFEEGGVDERVLQDLRMVCYFSLAVSVNIHLLVECAASTSLISRRISIFIFCYYWNPAAFWSRGGAVVVNVGAACLQVLPVPIRPTNMSRGGWQQKLSQLQVAQFPWDPKPEPPPAVSNPNPNPSPNPSPNPPTVPSNSAYQSQNPPAPQPQNPLTMPQPNNNAGPRIKTEPGLEGQGMTMPQPPFQQPLSHPPNTPQQSGGHAQNASQMQQSQQAYNSQHRGQAMMQAQNMQQGPSTTQRPNLTPEQYKQMLGQNQAQQMQQQRNAQNGSVGSAQTDGAGDDEVETMSVIKRFFPSGEEISIGRIEIDSLIRGKIEAMGTSMEGGGLMLPLRQAQGLAKRQHKITKSSKGMAQTDGGDDDDNGLKEELDEDAINSDLDDPDDGLNEEEEDDESMGHIMLCMYDKVQRVKNKWKCVMKDGVLTVNGKEYVFHKASGEYEW
ncbi:hypothetical protein PZA11_005875 [Diplocarpon coronariae]